MGGNLNQILVAIATKAGQLKDVKNTLLVILTILALLSLASLCLHISKVKNAAAVTCIMTGLSVLCLINRFEIKFTGFFLSIFLLIGYISRKGLAKITKIFLKIVAKEFNKKNWKKLVEILTIFRLEVESFIQEEISEEISDVTESVVL